MLRLHENAIHQYFRIQLAWCVYLDSCSSCSCLYCCVVLLKPVFAGSPTGRFGRNCHCRLFVFVLQLGGDVGLDLLRLLCELTALLFLTAMMDEQSWRTKHCYTVVCMQIQAQLLENNIQ